MQQFLDTNPGLTSRIAFHINFDDYTEEELYEILISMASKSGVRLSDEVHEKVIEIFGHACKHKDFGNGRFVRNIYEQALMNQTLRIARSTGQPSEKELRALKTIDKLTPCRYNAPTVLIVAYNKNNVFTYPGDKRNSGIEDATIVATHLMLAAYNEGVDSCWINLFNLDELAKAFNLPEDEEILMLLDLGVADKTTTPLPNHNSRKALTETVSFI